MTGLLLLAFGAGLLAPVNPCGFGLLPGFLAYTIGGTRNGRGEANLLDRMIGGLRAGIAFTVGFTGTFAALGLLLALGLRALTGFIPWLTLVLGAILTVAGVAMVFGWQLPLRLPATSGRTPREHPRGLVALGAGYALASASCSLTVLVAVITQAVASTSLAGVLLVFAAYAAGSAVLLLALATFAGAANGFITRYVNRLLPHLPRVAGAVLAVSGAYLIVYWLPALLGNGVPGNNLVTGLVTVSAAWLSAHQLLTVVVSAGLVLAISTAAVAARRRPQPADDDHSADSVDAPRD